MTERKGIPNFVGYWRARRSLAQEQLAAVMPGSVSKGTISAIEKGKGGFSLTKLLDLAEALGVSPGQILDGPGDNAPAEAEMPRPELPNEEDLAVILRTLAPLLSRAPAEEGDFPMIAGLLRTAAIYRRDNPSVPIGEFEGAVRMLVYHTEKRA